MDQHFFLTRILNVSAYVSQWGGWICLWINRIFHGNNSKGTRSPFCYKRQNMPLKINLICIWHHHLVHCFPFCLKCKSSKAYLIINKYKFSTSIRLQTVFKRDVKQTSYSKQQTVHSFFSIQFFSRKNYVFFIASL